MERSRLIRQAALASLLSALGVVVAPISWFPFLATKAFPGQHFVNAISGVLLGPIWAPIVAIIVGAMRIQLGIGTIYSMPGGIPGALVVGLVSMALRKARARPEIAALAEPVGTIPIGATLAVYVFAPYLGHVKIMETPLLIFYAGWAVSCIPGCAIGFLVLGVLKRVGITKESIGV